MGIRSSRRNANEFHYLILTVLLLSIDIVSEVIEDIVDFRFDLFFVLRLRAACTSLKTKRDLSIWSL